MLRHPADRAKRKVGDVVSKLDCSCGDYHNSGCLLSDCKPGRLQDHGQFPWYSQLLQSTHTVCRQDSGCLRGAVFIEMKLKFCTNYPNDEPSLQVCSEDTISHLRPVAFNLTRKIAGPFSEKPASSSKSPQPQVY